MDFYHWDIKRIDINQNPQAAAFFGVESTPTLILIYKDNDKDFIPISSGVVAVSEIAQSLYRGMRLLKGEITPEEWSMYEHQKGGEFDPNAPLNKEKNRK